MANGENAPAWIEEGMKIGLDLSWLDEDKEHLDERLERLGLPHPKTYKFSGDQVDSPEVDKLFEKSAYFCRLVPIGGGKRPHHLKLLTSAEFRDFCSGHDMAKYGFHLVEKGNVTHTGAIIASQMPSGEPGMCVIELIEGDAKQLFHGHGNPASAVVDAYGLKVIRYRQQDGKDWLSCFDELPFIGVRIRKTYEKLQVYYHWVLGHGFDRMFPVEHQKELIFRALKLIGGPTNPTPGYYEFDVNDGRTILFRSYESPDSQYAKLDGFI